MNVAIILFQNMRHAPFLNFYKNILEEIDGLTYDILYVDRHPELNEPKDEHHYAIPWPEWSGIKRYIGKSVGCLNFCFRVNRILKQKNYDRLIILTTMPAVILQPTLCKKFRNRYVVDIRDYTRENIRFFWKREEKAVKESAANVISSPAFVSFLPKAKYLLCHNLNIDPQDKSYGTRHFARKKKNPIVISYVGLIQYAGQCKRLIDLVKEDQRFEMRFYGTEGGTQEVLSYVREKKCDRVISMGVFKPEDKCVIYGESDLIFNCYGNDSLLVKCLVSNKHYDGAQFMKPLIVSPGTVMAELGGKNAYSLDLDHVTTLDGLYEWYQNLDEKEYEEHAKAVIDDALKTNQQTARQLKILLKI